MLKVFSMPYSPNIMWIQERRRNSYASKEHSVQLPRSFSWACASQPTCIHNQRLAGGTLECNVTLYMLLWEDAWVRRSRVAVPVYNHPRNGWMLHPTQPAFVEDNDRCLDWDLLKADFPGGVRHCSLEDFGKWVVDEHGVAVRPAPALLARIASSGVVCKPFAGLGACWFTAEDGLLCKYDPSGEHIWSVPMPPGEWCDARCITRITLDNTMIVHCGFGTPKEYQLPGCSDARWLWIACVVALGSRDVTGPS